MVSSRVILALAALAAMAGRATAKATTTPPSGLAFPPPKTVTVYRYDGDYIANSYVFSGYRLLGPFFQSTTGAVDAEDCFTACAAWAPKDPVKGPYCRSWSFNTVLKVCSLSEKIGCTVYTVNPKKQCVLWDKAKGVTSGWVAVPLQ